MHNSALNTGNYLFDRDNPVHRTAYSEIYYAIDERFGRHVCLKLLRYDNAQAAQLLRSEVIAQARAGDASPNVPVIIDSWMDEAKHEYVIVMQWIKGLSLREKMASANAQTFLSWMISLCGILNALHGWQIYHKDIKPENVIITPAGIPYLIDLNISIGSPNLRDGTPAYRAPEMHQTHVATDRTRADTFSVGAILYEFFTGQVPEDGMHYGLNPITGEEEFKDPSELNPTVPRALNDIIRKAMAYQPRNRYAAIRQLSEELKRVQREAVKTWKKQN